MQLDPHLHGRQPWKYFVVARKSELLSWLQFWMSILIYLGDSSNFGRVWDQGGVRNAKPIPNSWQAWQSKVPDLHYTIGHSFNVVAHIRIKHWQDKVYLKTSYSSVDVGDFYCDEPNEIWHAWEVNPTIENNEDIENKDRWKQLALHDLIITWAALSLVSTWKHLNRGQMKHGISTNDS